MELKEFIVGALTDITNAIKECQKNIDNGAIFAPTNATSDNFVATDKGDLAVSEISFDVAVTAATENTDGISGGGGINVLGMNFGAKGNNENKISEGYTSRIKFSIPIVFPPAEVDRSQQKKGLGLL